MDRFTVSAGGPLRGRVRVPGDKSISHRALLLGALAEGDSQVRGFLPGGDTLATLACIRALGIQVDAHDATTLTVYGRGLHGLRPPAAPLDCVRSGTTMRLLTGILAGQPFGSTLVGDTQLLLRPMGRVIEPLRRMGATIDAPGGRAPLKVSGHTLRGGEHTLAIASAQVKSALLLAGLYADGPTTVHQPGPARDHTERMLAAMGASLETDGLTVTIRPGGALAAVDVQVPGDISSAAFLLVAASLVPRSQLTVLATGTNLTRSGLLNVLQTMGADIVLRNAHERGNEPFADATARASALRGASVSGDTVVRMIDEFPVLAVAATQAAGTTVVRDAAELRVKETDRIAAITEALRALGAQIEPLPDGFFVQGPTPLHGGVVDSRGDHRLAMALTVAGLVAEGEVVVENTACVRDSFPGFSELFRGLGANVVATETRGNPA